MRRKVMQTVRWTIERITFPRLRTAIMICHQCLFRSSIRAVAKQVAPASAARTSSLLRPFSSSTIRTAQPISSGVAASSTPQRSPPAATSTSAAQPFSTPLTPSASALGVSSTGAKKSTALTSGVVSSVPAGTPLKGLNYLKNQTDPVAMEDHEYPAWLWEVLSEKKVGAGDEKEEIDPRLFCTFTAHLIAERGNTAIR